MNKKLASATTMYKVYYYKTNEKIIMSKTLERPSRGCSRTWGNSGDLRKSEETLRDILNYRVIAEGATLIQIALVINSWVCAAAYQLGNTSSRTITEVKQC